MLIYLLEIRQRLIYTIIGFCILFFIFLIKANDLLLFIVKPLIATLPQHQGLIATHITSPLLAPLKLAANAAFFLTVPIALFHLWRFISPGLYNSEQVPLRRAITFSILFFFLGVLFCFYVILPLMFQLFASYLPDGIIFMPDMTSSIDFITRMLLLFGLSFQVPLICWVLVHSKCMTLTTLKQIRPYVIVGAFIIGMLLTPPDVMSQIMLAVPLCILYELGIVLAKLHISTSASR